MMSSAHGRCVAALLALAPLAACASTSTAGGQSAPQPGASGPGAASGAVAGTSVATPSQTSKEAAKTAHPADVRFMNAMISHHSQALVMGGWAPTHGASQSVRTWPSGSSAARRTRSRPCSSGCASAASRCPMATATTMRMSMNGVEHDMHMPGMLTDAQMKELDAARGAEFDRLFLQLHDPASPGRRLDGDRAVRHARRRAGPDPCSSSPPTSTQIRPPRSSACRRCSCRISVRERRPDRASIERHHVVSHSTRKSIHVFRELSSATSGRLAAPAVGADARRRARLHCRACAEHHVIGRGRCVARNSDEAGHRRKAGVRISERCSQPRSARRASRPA